MERQQSARIRSLHDVLSNKKSAVPIDPIPLEELVQQLCNEGDGQGATLLLNLIDTASNGKHDLRPVVNSVLCDTYPNDVYGHFFN